MTTFKVGDRIRIAPQPLLTIPQLWNEEGVVVHVNSNGMDPDRVVVQLPKHQVPGYPADYHWHIGDASARLELVQSFDFIPQSNAPAAKQAVRQEKPCQRCGKKNDVGISKCWWCGSQPFTGNSAS